MTVGFDLDGTLDSPPMRELICQLIEMGNEVHIISGVFPEGDWQNYEAKKDKLKRLGIPFTQTGEVEKAHLHFVMAEPREYGQEYCLRSIGLRKGELCERLGIELYIDDSEQYCELIPKFSRGTQILQVK